MGKIKVGFIGCGRISDLHYLAYVNHPDAELVAICDQRPEVVAQKKQAWNVPHGYTDYREMLKNDAIEALEIIVPTHLHEEITLAAAEAGKHIALQKPMTFSMESARNILAVAQKTGKVFKITDNYLHYPPIVLAKKIIDTGLIGKVHNLRMKMFAGKDASGWEVPQESWGWRAKENEAGRPRQTFDHGHHLWAVAWFLMGEIERVFSWIDYVDGGLVDSPAAVMWRYKEPYKMGMCEYCYAAELAIPTKYYACDEWFEVTGSKGLVKVNRCNGNILEGPAVSVFNNDGWSHYDNIESDWSTGFVKAADNFIRAIQGKEAPMLTGEQGLYILKLDFAIQKAADMGHEVFVDEI